MGETHTKLSYGVEVESTTRMDNQLTKYNTVYEKEAGKQ